MMLEHSHEQRTCATRPTVAGANEHARTPAEGARNSLRLVHGRAQLRFRRLRGWSDVDTRRAADPHVARPGLVARRTFGSAWPANGLVRLGCTLCGRTDLGLRPA